MYSVLNSQNKARCFRIGEIYLMKFNGRAHEQQGWRPGLVFQNNTGNQFSPNIIALPLTSSLKKCSQPTHVLIPANSDTQLKKDSMVLCENPECISKDRIGGYITTLSDQYMAKITIASLLATSSISFINPEELLITWEKSLVLNNVNL